MSEKSTQAERDTDLETAKWAPVEEYLSNIRLESYRGGASHDDLLTLVKGNIRGFYSWLAQEGMLK